MTHLLCANAGCRRPGSHTTECQAQPDKPCRGCLPARAGDGLLLCWHHRDRLGVAADRLAVLFDDCELALAGGGDGGERPSGTQPGIELSEAAQQARALIQATLRVCAAMIAAGRQVDMPFTTVWVIGPPLPPGQLGPLPRRLERQLNLGNAALANFIGAHADYLAAHPKAGLISARFEYLVRLAYSASHPSGARIIHIGPCPTEVDDGPCPGKVRALMSPADELLPSSIICNHDRTHQWRSDEWRALGKRLGIEVIGYMTAIEISIHYRRPVGTIYRLASEKQWRRTADGLRPTRYDWRDVDQTMRSVPA